MMEAALKINLELFINMQTRYNMSVARQKKSLLERERLLSGRERHVHHEEEVLREKKEKLLEDVKHEQKKILERTTQKVDLIMKNLDKDHLKLHEIINAKTDLNKLMEEQEEEAIFLDNGPSA